MLRSSLSLSAVSVLLACFSPVAVDAGRTISAVGSRFFYEDGNQYFLKGAIYIPLSLSPNSLTRYPYRYRVSTRS
jgi:hypothetical protein